MVAGFKKDVANLWGLIRDSQGISARALLM